MTGNARNRVWDFGRDLDPGLMYMYLTLLRRE